MARNEYELADLLNDAARYGAAWPIGVRPPLGIVAILGGLLSLVRTRAGLFPLMDAASGLVDVDAPVRVVEGVQAGVWQHPHLRGEISTLADRLNSVVLFLLAEAERRHPSDSKRVKDQVMAWWIQLGECLIGGMLEATAYTGRRALPIVVRELVFQFKQGLAVNMVVDQSGRPVVVDPSGGGSPPAASAGGAGGGNKGSGGGGSEEGGGGAENPPTGAP